MRIRGRAGKSTPAPKPLRLGTVASRHRKRPGLAPARPNLVLFFPGELRAAQPSGAVTRDSLVPRALRLCRVWRVGGAAARAGHVLYSPRVGGGGREPGPRVLGLRLAPPPSKRPTRRPDQGAAPPAQVKPPVVHSQRPPYLLHFGFQVHVGASEGLCPPVRDLTLRPGWPPSPLRAWGTGGDASTAAAATHPAPSNFRRPVRRRSGPAARTGNKEAPAANDSRAAPRRHQSPSAARTFAARAQRWQGEGRGRVRGGAPRGARGDWDLAAPFPSLGPAPRTPAVPEAETQPFRFVPCLSGPVESSQEE